MSKPRSGSGEPEPKNPDRDPSSAMPSPWPPDIAIDDGVERQESVTVNIHVKHKPSKLAQQDI